jgi:hypothetical protein
MREIDYEKVLENIDTMINTLEYDCMRSGGKVKLNADTLINLINLRDYISNKIKKQPVKKEA